jgi:hypothetical protein
MGLATPPLHWGPMHNAPHLRLAAQALLGLSALWLTACQPAEPRADSLEPLTLLSLRFEQPTLDVTTLEDGKDAKSSERVAMQGTVHPLQVSQLDDTHAVLLTEVRGGPDCRNCQGIMGAYFYERDAQGWRLTQGLDALLSNGGDGKLGKLKLHPLAPGHHAATLEWGDCWQGNCGAWLSVVSLRPGSALALAPPIPLMIDTDGAYEACSALDKKPDSTPEKADAEPVPLHQQECHQISSTWHFQGKRLLMDFTGRVRVAKGEVLQAPQQIKQRAVYEMQDDALKRVEGENPFTGF